MNKLRITLGLLVGVGLVGTSALGGNDLAATQTRDNTTPSVFKNATTPTAFGGGAAGNLCVYDNYNPLDDLGSPASQADTYGFYAEAADDFVLPGDPATECLLSDVIFAVSWFLNAGGETPFACWTGVRITIYEDALEFCGPGFAKGAAGEPVDFPLLHIEYCPGGIKCEMNVSMDRVTGIPITGQCNPGPVWEIIVCALEELHCKLQKNHKYWIAIAPEQQFADCDVTAIVISANEVQQGNLAQQIFLILGIPWTVIPGNADACPPDTPPEGTHWDLSIGLAAVERCDEDLSRNGVVDAADLAQLLGQWGACPRPGSCPADFNGDGVVDATDLANLLGAWGPC